MYRWFDCCGPTGSQAGSVTSISRKGKVVDYAGDGLEGFSHARAQVPSADGAFKRREREERSVNPIGPIAGVLIGTVFIFSGIELTSQEIDTLKAQHLYNSYLRSEMLRVVKPYLALGIVVVF